MNDHDTTMNSVESDCQILAKLSETKKRLVFDALAAAKITSVLVEFDGEGDSGQINGITATCGENPIKLPTINIPMQQISRGSTRPVPTEISLTQAIETLCYDYLEQEFGGWENNDGAYGEFCFDVAERTITLDMSTRFSDVYNTVQTF